MDTYAKLNDVASRQILPTVLPTVRVMTYGYNASFKNFTAQQDWLLVFDNADDLESFRIAQYFPDNSWGHIVVTSRDQGAIGNVTKDGAVLDRLELGEAIAVLLQKAGFLSPSAEHYEEAKMIVEFLGCLSLAVDQAGAYIRSRRKNLTSYRPLHKDRQKDFLKFKPRLGEYDNTVFTTWDINFEQVEHDSKEASMLLLLFLLL